VKDLLRKEIASLSEYRLVQPAHRIKLNQNENPYDVPASIKREILERVAAMSWSRYPAFVPVDQISKVARFAGWERDGTLLGNGSNELLQLILTSALERGKVIVLSQPTFTLYGILARSLAATVVDVPMLPGFRFDTDRIIREAAHKKACMVLICSPNNPTGSLLGSREVARLLEETPGLVVLDEAYVHFAPESQVKLLSRYDRLMILQTFSKAMGAAGLRFGYALGAPELIKQLDKVKLPYNINIFTLVAAEVFIDRWVELKWWISALAQSRELLRRELETVEGLRVHPSGANFLLVETLRRTPKEVFAALIERGILVRDVSSYPGLERGLRITVGTPEENQAVLNALREVL
jgi:histidinol-phosphate aminotransferase